ncbi:winged helix-turn-helix domain-containing protein [Methylobacterium aquaticum]|uniref:helix-turn-helix domain-containing protein n=1 Tax=Methylobacterium aquaticum TaxID=270351 RepID=UPI003D16783D
MSRPLHCLDDGVSAHVVRDMRSRIDLLEEQVRQYREAAESTVPYPAEWGLTPKEARLIGALVRARGNVMSVPRLMVVLYGLEPDVEPKIVDVFVCKIRRKFRDAGIGVTVRTVRGEGYRIDLPDADRLRRLAADGVAPEVDTAGLMARIAELEAENAHLAAEVEAATAAAAPRPPPPQAETRTRRTWRELAAGKAETRNRAVAGLGRGGVSRQSHP